MGIIQNLTTCTFFQNLKSKTGISTDKEIHKLELSNSKVAGAKIMRLKKVQRKVKSQIDNFGMSYDYLKTRMMSLDVILATK